MPWKLPKGDWHPEDIKSAVRKSGTTLAKLARDAGLQDRACNHALRYPHFWAEMAIAERLGLSPRQIWPSRYTQDGERLNPPLMGKPDSRVKGAVGHCEKREVA